MFFNLFIMFLRNVLSQFFIVKCFVVVVSFLFCFVLFCFFFVFFIISVSFVCFDFCFSSRNVGHSVSLAFIMRFKAFGNGLLKRLSSSINI